MSAGVPIALAMTGVRKRYGKQVALDGLDLTVPRGVVCGMVGPNGAGKTTAFGIVGSFIQADAGTVDVLGSGAFDPDRHAGRMTMLPQDCELNPHVPVRALLVHFARMQGMTKKEGTRSADHALDLVALSDRAGSKIRQLSHGMRRRVAVAQAFLGEPELVLLDEPTNGLDPELVVRMRELFVGQRGKRTLIVSSHNLSELEAACDHVLFMDHGKCVRQGTLSEVTGRGIMIRVILAERIAIEPIAAALPDLEARWEDRTLVLSAKGGDAAELNARALPVLLSMGAKILEVRQGESLEAAYMAGRASA